MAVESTTTAMIVASRRWPERTRLAYQRPVLLAVNNTVVMGALPDDFRGVASGMLETTRHFAHAFGVTIPTAILSLVVTGLAGAGGDAAALRWGFFWSCLGMAAVAGMGVMLALVPGGGKTFASR